MAKRFIPSISLLLLLGSCSTLRQIDIASNKPIAPISSTPAKQETSSHKAGHVKFLDKISASTLPASPNSIPAKQANNLQRNDVVVPKFLDHSITAGNTLDADKPGDENISNAFALQSKYAVMMNTNPGNLQNVKLYEYIDDWYGTPYKLGGASKNGVDCSAFVQSLFAAVYGISLPRTSKYQHSATKRISTTELKEGDLLFFHTRKNFKGVTHVGIYLQNNKFVQASSSGGVTISDMYDPYYVKHLVGAGRAVENN